MQISGLEKLTLTDFPNKVACIVFTQGCNFRCPFCHNAGLVEDKYQKIETSEVMDYLIARKKMLDGVVISGVNVINTVAELNLIHIGNKGIVSVFRRSGNSHIAVF